MDSLLGTQGEWLHHLLHAFNKGDIHKYEQLVAQYEQQLAGQPILVQHVDRMKEKISILCLIELIFARQAIDRSVPLSAIAETTKVGLDMVRPTTARTTHDTQRTINATDVAGLIACRSSCW